ncbi:C-X-C motif chemokine 10 [Echinops telfairi]|uniref:C-X-C motif chemokine n=1 Tax=Echinops telfairi TaxID=9371 RepID=A0ABM0IM66_ECHTE|nr:C-X-C motif chemokine 10 [Echinops telfairi]
MDQRAIITFCLLFLTLSGIQGIPHSRTTRCSCIQIYDRPVNPKSLKKLEMIPASVFCPQVEIIATMKINGERRCLNPESKNVKNILKAISKERSKRSQRNQRKA